MTSAADKASREFAQKFNERLGQHTGSRAMSTTEKQRSASVSDMINASRTGTTAKAKKSTEKKKEPVKYIADAIVKANKEKTATELAKTHKDKPWWGDVLNVASRPLDIISRPSYAVAEGLRNVTESINAGEPVWSTVDDAWTGSIQGIMGKKKTGAGDVLEEAMSYSYDPENPDREAPLPTQAFDWLAKAVVPGPNPGVQDLVKMQQEERADGEQDTGILTGDQSVQWKRAYGLVGEVALDPTTYLGGGIVAGVRGSADNAAREISTAATKTATKSAVRKGVEKALFRSDPLINVKQSSLTTLTKIEDTIDEFGDSILRYVEAGPQRGKALYGKEMPEAFANHAASSYRQPLVDALETKANTLLASYKGTGKKLTRVEIASARKIDPTFGKYIDNITAQATDAIKLGQPVDYAKFHKKAMAELSAEIDEVADDIYKSVLAEVGQATVKTPTVRVLGKDVIAFRKTAGALDDIGRKMGATTAGSTIKKSFSFADNFPGYTSLLAQKVKSRAYQAYEEFHSKVDDAFKTLTRDEKKILTRALVDDKVLDNKLEPFRQQLKKFYDEIYDEEIKAGVRSIDDIRARNYNFVYLKGGKQTERRTFKEGRKAAIKATKSDNGFTFDQAKKLGLRPEEDAVKALLYRQKKSVRDMTRAWFQDDLVGHFGVASGHLRKGSVEARELAKVNRNHISKPQLAALREGEEYYVPKVVQDVFDTFHRMSTMATSEEATQWLRSIDWVTRKFKAMATIPFPSYHIRNMMGDMYMGFIDGVRLSDYKRVLGTKAGKEVKFLSIGGETMPFSVVEGSFGKTASSAGFMATDVTEGVGKIARNPVASVRKLSQAREDYGRFVHYTHALDEEYGKLKRIVDKKKRFEMAEDAAIYRVNKYKFDYGALTPFETSVMKRMIPFYTYTRKAIPTLTEALFLNPKIFSYTNKLLQDVSGTEGLSDMLAPDWMREIGYTKLTGEDEPLVLRHDFLPTNVFQLGNPGSGDQTQGLMGNLLGMLNPLIQAPMELSTGRDSFSGAPVKGVVDVLKNKIRPIKEAERWADMSKDWQAEQVFSKISGIGLSRISTEQQENQFKNMEDSVQRAVEKFNTGIEPKGYRIRYYINQKTSEMEYRIIKINADPEGKGKTVATAKTIDEAKKLANDLINR